MSSSATGVQGITEADIADYLANTPGFFDRHAELLAAIQLTSPHGQRAVSLQERQMEMLRDKVKGLEQRFVEMLRFGQDNVAIADKMHRWTCALLGSDDAAGLPARLVGELTHQFLIPQGAIRVWGDAGSGLDGGADAPWARPVSDDVKSFAASLGVPYCGVNAGFEAAQWLADPDVALSMAMVPLRRPATTAAFGLLVLASPDATRYTADMGLDFLVRIGEIASAALSRLLPLAR